MQRKTKMEILRLLSLEGINKQFKTIIKMEDLELRIMNKATEKAERYIDNTFQVLVNELHNIDKITDYKSEIPNTTMFGLDQIIIALEEVRDEYTIIDGKMNQYHVIQALLNLQKYAIKKAFFNQIVNNIVDEVK